MSFVAHCVRPIFGVSRSKAFHRRVTLASMGHEPTSIGDGPHTVRSPDGARRAHAGAA
jgi:hypothetical protein